MTERICSVDGCGKRHFGKGWCRTHYDRVARLGTTELPARVKEVCSVDGCERPTRARSWCNTHYMRWANHGDVAPDVAVIDLKPGAAADRLLRRVTVAESGCWIYGGTLINTGYGTIFVDGSPMLTHRFAYEHFVGPIPDGLVIDHLCMVRACCNPRHLEPVTTAENNRRAREAWSDI